MDAIGVTSYATVNRYPTLTPTWMMSATEFGVGLPLALLPHAGGPRPQPTTAHYWRTSPVCCVSIPVGAGMEYCAEPVLRVLLCFIEVAREHAWARAAHLWLRPFGLTENVKGSYVGARCLRVVAKALG